MTRFLLLLLLVWLIAAAVRRKLLELSRGPGGPVLPRRGPTGEPGPDLRAGRPLDEPAQLVRCPACQVHHAKAAAARDAFCSDTCRRAGARLPS